MPRKRFERVQNPGDRRARPCEIENTRERLKTFRKLSREYHSQVVANSHSIAQLNQRNLKPTSKDSDQPAHPRSLIRVFADRLCLLQPSSYPEG